MRIKQFCYVFLLCVFAVQSAVIAVLPVSASAAEIISDVNDISESNLNIIISAVQITGGVGKTSLDFIELFNPAAEEIDLNGYRLVKRTAIATSDAQIYAWSTPTLIPPYHFYIWANSSFSELAVSPDAVSSATIAADNGVALRQGTSNEGIIIDSLTWGSTANGFEADAISNPGANESVAVNNLFSDSVEHAIQASNPRNISIENLPPANHSAEDLEEAEEQTTNTNETTDEEEHNSESEEASEEPDSDETAIELPKILITEILPNPSGTDTGFEKVELFNDGNDAVNLKGFKIDDIAEGQVLSSNAYIFPDIEIKPGEFYVLTIPAGGFSLNNTAGDIVSIFNDKGVLLYSLTYDEAAPEGKSLSLYENSWYWGEPSFGIQNSAPLEESNSTDENEDQEKVDSKYDNSGLIITEIFPQPKTGGTEFIEIFNSGNETAQLSEISIVIGERKKVLAQQEIEAGEYYVLEPGDLPVQLRNSGQVVKLQQGTEILNSVTYPQAIEDASYAKFEDGFLWTDIVTKGEENILMIPEETQKEVIEKTKATTAKAATKSSSVKGAATSQNGTSKPANKAGETAKAEQGDVSKTENESAAAKEANISSNSANSKGSVGKIIAMGAAAVTAGIIALYKLVFTGTPD